MAITQDRRFLQLSTPLTKDFFLIKRVRCTEGLNQLFRIELDMLHEETAEGYEPTVVDPKRVLGSPMIVSAHQAGHTERYFNGICVQFIQGSRTSYFSQYRAELVPKVWMLTQISRSRIFQNRTIPQILQEVLEGYEFDNEIQGNFKPRNFCVQYRESDWDFASRLMEEEGIYYYFEHTANEHRLILGNVRESHRPCPSKPKVAYVLDRSELKEDWIPSIQTWRVDNKFVTGISERRDFHFQLPLNDLLATQTSRFDVAGNKSIENYDWPGGYAKRFDGIDQGGGENPSALNDVFEDRERTVRIRQEEIDAGYKNIHASSDCCSLTAGYRFEFEHHPIKENNINHVIITAQHESVQSPDYISGEEASIPHLVSFTCMPHGGDHAPFRPLRLTPKPVVQGSQTAKVVGNPGDEIFTDKYGRVKVHFHWDRSDYNDQQASAWIRVGTMFAGNKWGTMFIPRVGQEVIVDFLEGDPDQPIIVGSVYNPETMPHYELPKYKTLSYIKTHSTPKHQGYNELRFEDKAKKEQVFLYSQKRMDFRARGSHYETCGGNRQEVIGWNIKDGDEEDHGGNLAITVGGNYDLHVVGDQYIGIDKDCYEVIKGNRTEGFDGYHHTAVKSKVEVNSKSITLEASQKITLVVGSSCIIVDMMGITIQGPMVKINCGAVAPPLVPAKIGGPLDAEHADTGEPGYCDKPRKGGGGGGRKWGTTNLQHAPKVQKNADGSYQVGKNIKVQGSDEFVGKTLNALSEINNTKTGKNTLNEIDKGTHTTTIVETGGGNETVFDNNNDAAATGKPDLNGNPGSGKGTGSTVKFNPDREPPTAKDPSVNRPADVGLHHELVHAGHGANATDDNSPDPANPNNPSVEETETIKQDNEYRKERGIPTRDDHTKL
jgi:type VI secretion system secreted protein VgrG